MLKTTNRDQLCQVLFGSIFVSQLIDYRRLSPRPKVVKITIKALNEDFRVNPGDFFEIGAELDGLVAIVERKLDCDRVGLG